MGDLDFILGLGEEGESRYQRPRLVEVGRTLVGGKAQRRIFVWSTRRIGASFGDGRISIDRQLGLVGKGPVDLTIAGLGALNSACADWKDRRDGWAAFWASSAGYPAGFGGAWYYQAAGKTSRRIKVGSSTIGGKEGREFVGKDERRALAKPLAIARGVEIEAEIWRVGESFGNPKGEKIGVVYRLADAARFEAQRHEAILRKGSRFIGIEPDDEERFVEELLAAVRTRGQPA